MSGVASACFCAVSIMGGAAARHDAYTARRPTPLTASHIFIPCFQKSSRSFCDGTA